MNATLTITPPDALIDVSRVIQVTGLMPHQTIEIHTTTIRGNNISWQSHAKFIADSKGIVDVSQQPPISGTYKGIEPMGLIWSQEPSQISDDSDVFHENKFQPLETTITVNTGDQILQEVLIQHLTTSNIKRLEVKEQGLVGTIYLPTESGPHPAIMILNGSGGGINEHRAALYAAHGYIAFALAYFKAPGLSDYISNTPLEYFKKGLDWLRKNYSPLNDFVALNGQSRGGELVLLLASLFPKDISAVIAYVPGAVIHSGQNAADPKIGRDDPAWLFQGQPLPHIWENNKTAIWAPFDEGPSPHRHEKAILTALNDLEAIERARIPVEKIQAPIILLSATDDGAWPSSLYSKMVYERLQEFNHPYDIRWIDTPNGGHSIVFPYIPTTQITHTHPVSKRINTNGGEPTANAISNESSWNEIKDFLKKAVEGTK